MYRFLPFIFLTACGSSEPPQWYEHPCGNGDPVGIDCLDEADYIWEEPSTDLCSELDIQAGDECATVEGTCVLTQAYTCTSMGDGQRSSEELLSCRDEPYAEDPPLGT